MSYELSLFGSPDATDHEQEAALTRLRAVGVVYETTFLSDPTCGQLLASIDAQPWMYDLKRRVQHYGWKYDYASRFVTDDMQIGPLPSFIRDIALRLRDRGWFQRTPDQVIVNEYDPAKKQGIAPHVDRECFGPTVATLSLGDAWPMQFAATNRYRRPGAQEGAKDERVELVLDVGSILVLRGDSRSKWTHGIAARRTDNPGPNRRARRRRVSVTFRTVEFRT